MPMSAPQQRLELYVFLESLTAYLRRARDVTGAIRYTLRAAKEFLGANGGCVAMLQPGMTGAQMVFGIPHERVWDLRPLTEFILNRHPSIPPRMLMAPVRRRWREWGVIVLEREEGGFAQGEGHSLSRIAATLSETIERIDRERLIEVRSRIDRKIMEELRPRDLFYQILDGLRSLTRYDHSSALLIHDPGQDHLKIEAEQIAWSKAKSHRIGATLPVTPGARALLERGEVYGFERGETGWTEWLGREAGDLARLLDFSQTASGARDDTAEREAAILCATLGNPGNAFGVLKIAWCHTGSFNRYEADILDGFRLQAAVAIRNSLRAESLQARMLEAERKHAMADLARGVSHDVNNALGTALPLVQQMQADLREARLDPAAFSEDLDQVQRALQLCRRIFGGMLAFTRTAARGGGGEADVRRAARSALAILEDSLAGRGIHVVVEIAEDLPPVAGGQSDLERIFFNLISNAREATPRGGRVCLRARREGRGVEILVEDTGHGIPADQLPHVLEPFYTTRAEGNGLGLSICRSILWQMNGDMSIESEPGKGTRIRIRVPGSARAEGDGS